MLTGQSVEIRPNEFRIVEGFEGSVFAPRGGNPVVLLDLSAGYAGVYAIDYDPSCPADTNGDGVLTPTDFTAWINAFNNNLPECDQNGDNACTPTDFTAWLANYNTGC